MGISSETKRGFTRLRAALICAGFCCLAAARGSAQSPAQATPSPASAVSATIAPTASPAPGNALPPTAASADAMPAPSPSPTPSPIEAAAADSAAGGITPESPPRRLDDVPPLREKINARIADLEKLRAPEDATEEEKALAATAAASRALLETALKKLDAFEAAHRQVDELGSPERIAARNAQLEDYRKRTTELLALDPATWTDARRAEFRQEIAQEHEKIQALTEATVTQQTAREQTLSQFAQTEQEAATQLTAARQALSAALARTSPAPSPTATPGAEAVSLDAETQRQIRDLEVRQLALQVFLSGLRLEQLAVEKVVLNLESAAATAAIPVLEDYANALWSFRGRVVRDDAQEVRDTIARELEAATTPHAQAYWRVRQVISNGRWLFGTQIPGLREELRALESPELTAGMERISERYERLLERLDRTTGVEKTKAYQELLRHIKVYAFQHEDYASRLDEARRRLEQLYDQKDEVLAQLKEADGELRAAIPGIETPEERAKFDQLVAELASDHQPRLDSVISTTIERRTLIISRLEELVGQLATFSARLKETRDKLFWAYTLARGPGVIRSWRRALSDFSMAALRADWDRARADARLRRSQRDPMTLAIGTLGFSLALAAGWFYRRRLWRASDAYEEKVSAQLAEGGTDEVHLNDRVRIQVLRMLAMVLPIALPALVALYYVWQGELMTAETRAVAMRLLVIILIAAAARAAIKRLFRAGKPRFRIIPCSNVVANYYRFWLSVLWWISVPMICVIQIMRILEIRPLVSEALHISAISLTLLILVYFARHRQMVVRVVGRTFALRRPLLFGFIVRAYPILLLSLMALLVLEIMGYDALVTFVLYNALQTLFALSLASLISNMLYDFARRGTVRAAETASAAGDAAAAPEYGIDEMLQQYESREWGLLQGSLAALGQWAAWIGAAVWIATAWGMTRGTARSLFAFEIVPVAPDSGRLPVTVGRILLGLIVVFGAFKLSRMLVHTLSNKIYPVYGNLNKAAQATINTLLHYTLITVGLYIGLRIMQIELGALVVLLGGLGLGIGLGLQPLLVNFVSGLILFAERHVKVGDLVKIGDDLGEVMSISMRSTRVRTPDGIDIVIPNTELVTSKVVNWTLQDTKIRGQLPVGVAYGSDVNKVRAILLEIAHQNTRVLLDPEPAVWFTEFGESSLNFTLAAWFATPGDRWFGMIDMRYEIDRRFRDEGIEIPFPQRALSVPTGTELPIRVVPRERPAKAPSADAAPPAGPDPAADASSPPGP